MCWREYNCCSSCWKKYHRSGYKKRGVCKGCGKISDKAIGMCWDKKGMCANCAKNIYNKLKCKECGGTSRHTGGLCWKEDLCGKCHRKKQNPRRYEPTYSLCKCGERLISLTYTKRGTYVRTPYKICTKCSVVHIYESKYKLLYTPGVGGISSETILSKGTNR